MRQLKIVKGLVDWLTGGLSARVDYIERDMETLESKTVRIEKEQEGIARVVKTHHEKLAVHESRINAQAEQMIALRKMHGQLAGKVGEPFPGKLCSRCGAPMVFDRVPEKKAYSLSCSERCGEFLLLPEQSLLKTLGAAD